MVLLERLHAAGNTIIVVTHEHDIAAHARRIVSIRTADRGRRAGEPPTLVAAPAPPRR